MDLFRLMQTSNFCVGVLQPSPEDFLYGYCRNTNTRMWIGAAKVASLDFLPFTDTNILELRYTVHRLPHTVAEEWQLNNEADAGLTHTDPSCVVNTVEEKVCTKEKETDGLLLLSASVAAWLLTMQTLILQRSAGKKDTSLMFKS